jgi:glycosyltransferase involved in cell wall biosynthesis
MLTSWSERCGIADYSHHLVDALRSRTEVEVVHATMRPSPRAVYQAMGTGLRAGDVAHVQHAYSFFGGMHPLRSGWRSVADTPGPPIVLTAHELDLRATGAYRLPPAVERAYKRRFNRATFLHPRVRRWMVHAGELRDALLDLGAPEPRVHYRPLPVSPPPRGPVLTAEMRSRLKLEGRRALVILGFLARRKGYDLALEALRRLPEEYVLVAAGGEHEADRTGTEQWIRGLARELGVMDRLRITGYLSEPELEQVTALADVVLAPFHEMSASASLHFALARGKAVVASDLGENRTLNCVELFPAGDVAALESAIRFVGDAPLRKRELAAAAARYVRGHSYEALAEACLSLYREVRDEARV